MTAPSMRRQRLRRFRAMTARAAVVRRNTMPPELAWLLILAAALGVLAWQAGVQ